jgi:hypothetical protein
MRAMNLTVPVSFATVGLAMTTKRPAPPKSSDHREPSSGAERLDSVEEKVIRMRRGLGASDNLELEFMGRNHPDTLARLREIEHRAFEKSGRIAAMKKAAAEEDEDEEDDPPATVRVDQSTKSKIVSGMRDKSGQAEAKVGAKAAKLGRDKKPPR